ncbi:MAG: hypothetical protein DCC75_13815 [Proteobacteria bacterium]|nr:MAG: hypothetical protein DCC75_13815 [Pseudomonadota bacterium]
MESRQIRGSSKISGDLKVDSPALFAQLKSFLPVCDLQRVASAYRTAHEQGGTVEAPTRREPEASFNPKPARLCHILVSEAGVRDPLLLSGAILRCVQSNSQNQNFQRLANIDQENLLIELAWSLDRIRHLHMTDLDTEQRCMVLEQARSLLESIPEQDASPRLTQLLSKAIQRCERTFDGLAA